MVTGGRGYVEDMLWQEAFTSTEAVGGEVQEPK
jgi:hypothetical protein